MDFNPASITDSRNGRLLLFGFLYFVQGAMLAYVLVFNNLYLRHFGATAGQLSLLNGLLAFPFILKIGIGILSDKVEVKVRYLRPVLGHGHRIPYITLGLLFIASGGIVAVFIHPVEMYGLFLITALFIAFGLAVFDTVADGLAIDTTPAGEQTIVQGAMVVGRAAGLVMLAAVYGRLIQAYDWTIVFWVIIIFSLAPLPLLKRVREPTQRSECQTFSWQALAEMWRPDFLRFFLYAIIYSIPVYGTNAIITLYANEGLGGTLIQVGNVAALAGLGMVFGGVTAVFLSNRVSIWQLASMTGMAVTVALLLIALVANLDNFILLTFSWGFCLSAADFVYVTLSMAKSDRRMGAGQFAIFMAISNVGTGIGQATTTGMIDTVDFRWIFTALAVINLLIFPLLAALRADGRILMVIRD